MLPQAGSYWRIVDIHPANAPFQQLAVGLLADQALRPDYADTLGQGEDLTANLSLLEKSLCRNLQRGAYSLHEIWQQGSNERPAGSKLLLLVDQFEELFRYAAKISADQSAAFVALLLAAARHPDIYLILTIRSEFLGHCAQFEHLPEAINQGLYLMPKMDRDQLRDAIEGPVEMFGGEVEPALVTRMLNDLSGQQDQLPLLQHCLMRLWYQVAEETSPCLTLRAYEELGGLRRALSDHADEAYIELDQDQQKLAKILFQALTEQEGGLDTRRPETIGTIARISGQDWKALLPVIEAFCRQGRNFLTASVS
nr:hypothetical protein [Candidatus Electrothrix aestuarii]